jgi:hypothetical protein
MVGVQKVAPGGLPDPAGEDRHRVRGSPFLQPSGGIGSDVVGPGGRIVDKVHDHRPTGGDRGGQTNRGEDPRIVPGGHDEPDSREIGQRPGQPLCDRRRIGLVERVDEDDRPVEARPLAQSPQR